MPFLTYSKYTYGKEAGVCSALLRDPQPNHERLPGKRVLVDADITSLLIRARDCYLASLGLHSRSIS